MTTSDFEKDNISSQAMLGLSQPLEDNPENSSSAMIMPEGRQVKAVALPSKSEHSCSPVCTMLIVLITAAGFVLNAKGGWQYQAAPSMLKCRDNIPE